jgi:four helix bundle protein
MDKPHKKLNVWKLSMDLADAVYRLTTSFPAEEKFGLTSQLRRAAVSVPSNLAEGAASCLDAFHLATHHLTHSRYTNYSVS